jgi:uncharacterized BrkB/YihY/UPF0761 family membrane protein
MRQVIERQKHGIDQTNRDRREKNDRIDRRISSTATFLLCMLLLLALLLLCAAAILASLLAHLAAPLLSGLRYSSGLLLLLLLSACYFSDPLRVPAYRPPPLRKARVIAFAGLDLP